MITKQQLADIYFNCYTKLYGPHDEEFVKRAYYEDASECDLFEDYLEDEQVDEIEMTNLQWQSLVNVCRAIADHRERFETSRYHCYNECGTAHCIAGWAVAVELNDFDIQSEDGDCSIEKANSIMEKYGYDTENIGTYTAYLASAILSPLVYPFFYLTGENSNEVVFNEFIQPVLQIANQQTN